MRASVGHGGPAATPLRVLLLDLDDTLIDDRGAMADAVLAFRRQQGLCAHFDDEHVAARWDAVARGLWQRMAAGEVSFLDQRRMRLRQTFELDLSDAQADALFQGYLDCYERCWRLLPGTRSFLDRTRHLKRVIVTNGHRPQATRKLARLGLDSAFDAVVTPDDCGASKPDAKIFLHALRLVNLRPEEAAMIGDNEAADIAPALALGMRTFHIQPQVPGRRIEDAAGWAG